MDKLKEHGGKIGIGIAILSLAWTSVSGYVQERTHASDIEVQHERRISDLENALRNDMATRREVEALGAKVDHVQTLLEQEIEFHHSKKDPRR